MSKLLHSKTFRNNLFKWIMIYTCVMLSTVYVITYSKYISELESNSSSRTAKFKIDVTKGDICSVLSPSVCNINKFKYYDKVDYNFSIDTSEMEVSTLVFINIIVDSSFTIDKLYVDDEEINFETNNNYELVGNTINITNTINVGYGTNHNYKLRLSYKNNSVDSEFTDAVVINYSATQID